MIWNATSPLDPSREALRDHLADALREAAARTGADVHYATELADGVAVFCLKQHDRATLASDHVWLLLSRALCAVGQVHLGEALLGQRTDAPRDLRALLPLVRDRSLPASLCEVCAAETVRPSRWAVSRGAPTWVVDLRRFVPRQGELLELVLFRCLEGLLQSLAAVWDESGGRGVLGLVGLGRPPRRRAGPGGLREETLGYCRDILRREGRARGWADTPEVVGLDLRAGPGRAPRPGTDSTRTR